MQAKRESINKQIRDYLEGAIKDYKALSKYIDNLERALTLNNAQELSLAVNGIFHYVYSATFLLNGIKEFVDEKRMNPEKKEEVYTTINKANARLVGIYLNSENIEKNFKQNNREPIDGLLKEIKQDYKDIEQYLNNVYEFI